MQNFKRIVVLCLMLFWYNTSAQKTYEVKSPDGKITTVIVVGQTIQWSVAVDNVPVVSNSTAALYLGTGEILGNNVRVISGKQQLVDNRFKAEFYKKEEIVDNYNRLILKFEGSYGMEFRVFNDGVAYRFVTDRKNDLVIKSEVAEFNFPADHTAYIPYVRDLRGNEQFVQSFEATYDELSLSEQKHDTLSFLPILVESPTARVVILEADVEEYPGMFLTASQKGVTGVKGVFAGYPLEEFQGGYNKLNTMVSKRADYIARVKGSRSFPWRAVVIASQDVDLLNNDMVQKLASPSRVKDVSWVKPGKVAWDWWNDWNISGVDFRAGINTDTYKYYIDFAAENKIEYIVIDEGWSNSLDLMQVSNKMDLKAILQHAKQKNVDVILWASWYAVNDKLEEAFSKYAAMGVKGFKIDFMDRDDQKMVSSLYAISAKAAEHKLILDFHGMYKPTGIQRTFPNVLNFEGVKGLENVKWTLDDDMPRYDATLPFVRMVAGPMDYTPGAMRNAIKPNFRAVHSLPMSQGTRCHQLALYIIFEAPLNMLADSPTAYKREKESTDFIAAVPTTFNETIPLAGDVGNFAAIARRKGDTWYVGAITNWDTRELTLDFSFLGSGTYSAEIFRDGINADRDGTDYKREIVKIVKGDKINIHLAPGGGWAARITKQ